MGFEVNEISLLNPPDDVYFMQLNVIRDIFNNDYESVLMSGAIKNTKLMFFQTLADFNTYSQVDCLSGNMELAKSSSTKLDAMDSITNWAEDGTIAEKNTGTFSLNTDAAHYIEGTGSILMDVDFPSPNKRYIIKKTITSADWSSYDELKIWVKCDHPDDANSPILTLSINGIETSSLTLANGSQYYTFDITGITRTAVTSWSIKIKQHDGVAFKAYCDDLNGITAAATYYTSGNGESVTVTTPTDIKEIFVYEKIVDEPEVTTIVKKISLDDGTTWHTLTGSEFNQWVDITAWVESFTVENKLRIRIELTTTDNTVTPKYDDIMVAYKLAVT